MTCPVDPLVCELVDLLDDDMRESFEERAAIMEFDGGLRRAHAECLALLGLLYRHALALTQVRLVEFQLAGGTRWLLTTDLRVAREHLGFVRGVEVGEVDIAKTVTEEFGGLAMVAKAP